MPKTTKALLDKNLVIDLIQARPRKDLVLQQLTNFDTTYISTNTFVTIMYILNSFGYRKEDIQHDLYDFELLDISTSDCRLGYSLASILDDVEDCIELFLSQRHHCRFLTADKKLVKTYGEQFNVLLIE